MELNKDELNISSVILLHIPNQLFTVQAAVGWALNLYYSWVHLPLLFQEMPECSSVPESQFAFTNYYS